MYCVCCNRNGRVQPLLIKSRKVADGSYHCFLCEHCCNRLLSEIESAAFIAIADFSMIDYKHEVVQTVGGIYFTEEIRRHLLREKN